jgi:hypothetical protein
MRGWGEDQAVADFESGSHPPCFRFLAASARLTRVAAETSSISQIQNSVTTGDDLSFPSSRLIQRCDRPARNLKGLDP